MSTDAGTNNIVHFSPGEVIFREGQNSKSFYVIKSGEIDISITHGGKNIILKTLQPGETFGETAALLCKPRNATAVAKTYTEAYSFTKDHLDKVMERVPMVVRKLLQAQLRHVADANSRAESVISNVHPLIVATELIQMQAKAIRAERREKGTVSIAHKVVIKSICRMMGLSAFGADQLLGKMEQYSLIAIKGSDHDREIEVDNSDLVSKAELLSTEVGYDISGQYAAESEYMDLNTLISFTGADRGNILRKLAAGELADKTFLFRRSEIVDLLNQQGKDFFQKRSIKPMKDWGELEDLEFVDTPTLERAMGLLEPYELAVLILGLPDGPQHQRLQNALSGRRQEMVQDMAEDFDEVSDVDIQITTDTLFNKIRDIRKPTLVEAV